MENGKLKSLLIGTIEKLPTLSDAERAVGHLRLRINAHNPQQQFHSVTVDALIDRLLIAQAIEEGLPIISADAELDRYGIPRIW